MEPHEHEAFRMVRMGAFQGHFRACCIVVSGLLLRRKLPSQAERAAAERQADGDVDEVCTSLAASYASTFKADGPSS
jgi:hypothetical protein